MISFTVPGEPQAKGRPRATIRRHGARVFASAYTPEKTRIAEQTFAARCMEFRPAVPLEGPLVVEINFIFSIPRGWPAWKIDAAIRGAFHHVSKPDCDNAAKLCLDAMCGVFFVDDRQIVSLAVTKTYGAVPRTVVRIESLQQAERKSA